MVPAIAPSLRRFPDLDAAARGLASRVADLARAGLEARGRFALALSGGSSPVPLFRALASEFRAAVAWERVDIYWADERAVPPEDPRSNYGLADRTWLSEAALPASRIHRIPGERRPVEEAAREYESTIRRLERTGSEGDHALLDLALLGIGEDGHTASLFPGSTLLGAQDRLVGVEPRPGREPYVPRITLTRACLERSRVVAFLAGGTEKREILARLIGAGPPDPSLPAGQVHGLDATEWYVDTVG